MARRTLSRNVIVAAAFAELEVGGLTGLTARSLAARLGVQPGALYHHVRDMATLRDEMATALTRDMFTTGTAAASPPGWREMIEQFARTMRTVLLAHRDGARLFSGTRLTDPALIAAQEEPLRRLTGQGFTIDEAVLTFQTVRAFVTGHVIEEQHRAEAAAANPDAYSASLRAAQAPESAVLVRAASARTFGDPDEAFEWGLRAMIRGVAGGVAGAE